MSYPPPMQPAAAGKDNSQLLGIIGAVVGLICCWPAGVVLGVLSLIQANKFNSSKTWAILAFVASAINLIFGAWYVFAFRDN